VVAPTVTGYTMAAATHHQAAVFFDSDAANLAGCSARNEDARRTAASREAHV
jgi:hypothetical protein